MKIYWNKESNSKNLIGQKVKELRTERQLSQKALAEQLQLAGYEFSDLTVLRIEQGTRFVPDYEVVALAEFFHVSCEYLLGVKKENREYEKFLSDLSTEQRNFLENYMDIVDHAHFQEQQRAYYQGIVDAVQILAGLGIVKESVKVKELLNTIMK